MAPQGQRDSHQAGPRWSFCLRGTLTFCPFGYDVLPLTGVVTVTFCPSRDLGFEICCV